MSIPDRPACLLCERAFDAEATRAYPGASLCVTCHGELGELLERVDREAPAVDRG